MTEDEFRGLYESLSREIFAFARRQLGTETANDVVADTFATVWEKRPEFPTDRADWPAWIVGIASNKVRQERTRVNRKHHDNRFVEDWITPSHEPSVDDPARQVVEALSGRQVYDTLSPAEQHLFGIAFFKELTPEQAATILDISVTAFTTRVSRLRRRIRDLTTAADNDHIATPKVDTT